MRYIAAVGLVIVLAALHDTSDENLDLELTPEPLDPTPGQVECPSGDETGGMGPEMTRLPEGFCIDNTEVTRAQYEAWLDSSPAADQPGACADNESFEPACAWPPGGSDGQLPVVCVDWCDAAAFCRSAGKRLCGRVGDGDVYALEDYDDPAVSEWFAACSSGGQYEYTYGDDIDRARCRGGDAEDFMTWGMVDVASLSDCHSPDDAYRDVHDLSGNAAEWDGSCEGEETDAPCRIRGGGFEHQHHGLRCAMGRNLHWPRMRQQASIGFRCCAD